VRNHLTYRTGEQSHEHRERGHCEPAGGDRLRSADHPEEQGSGTDPSAHDYQVPREESELVALPAVERQWEEEVLRQLDGQPAATADTDLPSSSDAKVGETRYPTRSRSAPDRYGDWRAVSQLQGDLPRTY
jgi:hypothetical protein